MHFLLIVLRLLHIGLGVFWAGAFFFVFRFLMPSLRDAGPAASGKVMQGVMARRFPTIMPIAAILTIVSGLALMWVTSGGFAPIWTRSRMGMTLMTGGGAAILAFLIGMIVVRPATLRLPVLGQAAEQLTGADRDAKLAEFKTLEQKVATGNAIVAALLGVAVIAMAVARYL